MNILKLLATAGLGAMVTLSTWAQAQAEERVLKIAAPLPLTGGLAPEGQRLKQGYDLWAEAQNAAGGIKAGADTYKVEILYSDYQSNTPRAVQSVERMISEDKVDAIFAPFGSGATKAVSAVTERYGVPMIASNAASVEVYDQGFKYLFGMYTPNESVVQPMVDLVMEKNPEVKKVALLARNDLFPLAIAGVFSAYVKEKGLELVAEQQFPIGTVDFGSTLAQMRAAEPDWLYVTGYVNDMILIRKQMEEQGVNPKLVSMLVGPTTPFFLSNVGANAENITTSAWWDASARFENTEDVFGSTAAFVEAYRAKHGEEYLDYSIASAAACGAVLQIAITQAGTADKAAVRDALASMDVPTFFGRVKFGENGQITSLEPPIMQIQEGEPKVVYPADIKSGDLRFNEQ